MLGFSPKTAQCSHYTNYTILAREEISLCVIVIDVFSPVSTFKGVLEGDCQQFLRHLLDICGM
jgi:hypothetical protein